MTLNTIRTILEESANKREQFVTKLEKLEHALKEVAVAAQEAKQESSSVAAMEFYEGFYYRRAQKPNEVGVLVTQPSGIGYLIAHARQLAASGSK